MRTTPKQGTAEWNLEKTREIRVVMFKQPGQENIVVIETTERMVVAGISDHVTSKGGRSTTTRLPKLTPNKKEGITDEGVCRDSAVSR